MFGGQLPPWLRTRRKVPVVKSSLRCLQNIWQLRMVQRLEDWSLTVSHKVKARSTLLKIVSRALVYSESKFGTSGMYRVSTVQAASWLK